MKRLTIFVVFQVVLCLASFAAAGETPDPIPVVNGMIFIPAGEFIMGSSLADLKNLAELDEYPQRHVYVAAFYMDVHEVTNAEYKRFVDSTGVETPDRWVNGNYPVGEDGFPVVDISWTDAVAYASFVGKRLPTEAEWEKAARGTDGRRYPWGDEFDVTRANNGDRLMPIMSFPTGKSP